MKSKIWIMLLTFSLLSLTGCTTKTNQDAIEDSNIGDEQQDITIGEPNPQGEPSLEDDMINSDPSQKISSDAAILKSIKDIKSITLSDLEGNLIDKTFSKDEILTVEAAYNESVIQDTAYIEMIAGNTMLISLVDETTIYITSYGDENFIVATSSTGNSYHLLCPVIGKLLLETN